MKEYSQGQILYTCIEKNAGRKTNPFIKNNISAKKQSFRMTAENKSDFVERAG